MTPISYRLTLSSREHYGGKLPPRFIGLFLAETQSTVRAAVAMAFRKRSTLKGKSPDWLKRSADIRFVGFEASGQTTLQFEAPQFRDAAEELYHQPQLFPTQPEGADTALDALNDILLAVASEDADSLQFDGPLLRKITRFRRVFDGPFDELILSGRRSLPAHLSAEVIESAEQLSAKTPHSRPVRVVGILDTVSRSKAFIMTMDNGEPIRAVLLEGEISEMLPLFGKRVLIFGKAHFRPSGNLLRVDATHFRAATENDSFFAKIPLPIGGRTVKPLAAHREKMTRGLNAALGQWPGDESDDEIQAALKELG